MDALVGPGDAVADGGMQIGTVSSKACASVFKASAGLYIETLEVGGNCDDIRIVRNIEQISNLIAAAEREIGSSQSGNGRIIRFRNIFAPLGVSV